jgi:hypothetical protein
MATVIRVSLESSTFVTVNCKLPYGWAVVEFGAVRDGLPLKWIPVLQPPVPLLQVPELTDSLEPEEELAAERDALLD